MTPIGPDGPPLEVVHRVRIGAKDVHYAGGLVDGARILQLFGDATTELMARTDGEEGLLAAYESVEFLAPTHAGDFLEIRATLLGIGRSSRRVQVTAVRYIGTGQGSPTALRVLAEPVPVCRGTMIAVVPVPDQDGSGEALPVSSI